MAQIFHSLSYKGMFYHTTKVPYIWILYSNSGYIRHYGPKACRYNLTTSKTGLYMDLSILYLIANCMHEADDAYSSRSMWSCYWLDQFLTSIQYMDFVEIFNVHWICLLSTLLILVGVKLPLCIVITAVTLSQNALACFLESS